MTLNSLRRDLVLIVGSSGITAGIMLLAMRHEQPSSTPAEVAVVPPSEMEIITSRMPKPTVSREYLKEHPEFLSWLKEHPDFANIPE